MNTRADSPSLHHLLGRLGVVEDRVRAAVAARRAVDPDADDAFRGLYVSDAYADRLLSGAAGGGLSDDGVPRLAQVEAEADVAEAHGSEVRLRQLGRTLALDALDVEILLIALAVDLDARFEKLYGYLNDDVSRRRATIGLCLELCGIPAISAEARARFGEQGALVAGGILVVEEGERPFLTRSLRVPDRVAGHLLGDDCVDPLLAPLIVASRGLTAADSADPGADGRGATALDVPGADSLAAAIRSGAHFLYVRDERGASARSLAHAALRLARVDGRVLSLDLRDTAPSAVPDIVQSALREALLTDSALVLGPIEALVPANTRAVERLAAAGPCVILCGDSRWDPAWSRSFPLTFEASPQTDAGRSASWAATLNGRLAEGLDVARETSQFRLSPEQASRAAELAALRAAAAGTPIGARDLAEACREQNSTGLGRLARRIEPSAGWDRLILPSEQLRQLHEVANRARFRRRVLDEWGLGGSGGGKRGISALFAGPSGTGKTMAAEVLAHELELDLYRVDLASVVDKYIGETEKNLGRIFDEAEGVSGVLLFDEADALFGRRSEVKDSHDRYANIEVAYLLQRMESFDGVAILATNLRANLDEAFTRRLDIIVDFPLPDETARRQIWQCSLSSAVPQADDIDFGKLARAFDISGGDIRNVCLAAAYTAAVEGRALGMADVLQATEREYRKLGRLGFEQSLRR